MLGLKEDARLRAAPKTRSDLAGGEKKGRAARPHHRRQDQGGEHADPTAVLKKGHDQALCARAGVYFTTVSPCDRTQNVVRTTDARLSGESAIAESANYPAPSPRLRPASRASSASSSRTPTRSSRRDARHETSEKNSTVFRCNGDDTAKDRASLERDSSALAACCYNTHGPAAALASAFEGHMKRYRHRKSRRRGDRGASTTRGRAARGDPLRARLGARLPHGRRFRGERRARGGWRRRSRVRASTRR